MYDLIIVGGGPAGLTAAIYAIRKRLNVLVVSKDLGGKTNYRLALPWIEDYQVIKGLEVVRKFRNELTHLEFAHRMEPVERVLRQDDGFVVTSGGGELQTRAVIIATGARQQFLGVPGERKFMMHGLCYSAVSYAPLFIDRTAVVIGNGDLALRSAAELATIAKHLDLVWTSDSIPLTPLSHKLRLAENVTILEGHQASEITGGRFANAVVLKDPQGQLKTLNTDGIFVELSLIPNSSMVKDLVELDNGGHIKIDSSNRSSLPGIFAAGDVTNTQAEQVLIAVGEGAKAALSAYEFLLPSL